MLRRVVLLLVPTLLLPGALFGAPADLHVAAASSCAPALTEIGQAFEKQGGEHVVFSFGSSGLLARQVAHGAPFDVFVAAEPAPVDALIHSGDADVQTRAVFARGALDLWWRTDLKAPPTRLADLAQPRFAKIAIANPELAPYGRAAREALTQLGIWQQVQARLVYGENVQQALQFAQSGNADVALVAHSLAIGVGSGQHLALDPALHGPVDAALVVCTRTAHPAAARAFAAFLLGPTAQRILGGHGWAGPPAGRSTPR